MIYRKYFYLFNFIIVFLTSLHNRYSQGVKEFLVIVGIYQNPFYMQCIYLLISLLIIHQHALTVNYFALSRYNDKEEYLFSRYFYIIKECLFNSIFMVVIPLFILTLCFNEHFDVYLQTVPLWIGCFFLSVFICLLSFTCFLLFSFFQRNKHYVIIFGASLFVIFGIIHHTLISMRVNDLAFYVKLQITLKSQYTLWDNLFYNSATPLLYSVLVMFLGIYVFKQKIEFYQYERDNK